ncbi:MAG: Demethylmenaquinone methyltransferase [Chlamydiae bacterium]|nr:Demethylmenaquinone methyltransferase [Chlamydiota bacterium]
MAKQSKTSWESSAKWYDETVGQKGHYYHENVIFPKLLKMMELEKNDKVLDLACGQGVLSRKIPKIVDYVGVDISKSLIKAAKIREKGANRRFFVQDVTKKWAFQERDFTHGAILLALQNLEDPLSALKNTCKHLVSGGKLFLVLNHPCFRIPRQSHWGIDEAKKMQYRRMDAYLTPQKIPIQMHPGVTWSFHHSLSAYSKMLREAGFCILEMQEWVSDKKSTGAKARMEDRARREFPLFLAIACQKIDGFYP